MAPYRKLTDLPQVAPLFPLDGVLLLPRGQLPLNIFEPRYLNMIDDAMAGDRVIAILQTRGGDRARPSLAEVGCAGRITAFAETQDGRYLLTLTGVNRFRLGPELQAPTPYRQARLDYAAFAHDLEEGPDIAGDRPALLDALRPYLENRGLSLDWDTASSAPPEALVNSLAMALPFEPAEKQALLEAADLQDRLDVLVALLRIDATGPGEDDDAPPMQ